MFNFAVKLNLINCFSWTYTGSVIMWSKTSWSFIELTEKIGKGDVRQLIIQEKVLIGDDVVGNMGTLTKVEIFSSMLKPRALSIKGEKVRGIIAENREEEYFYHALFEDVHAGERMRFKVFIKGKSTRETLKEDGYYSNFAWNTPHIQRIIFPKDGRCCPRFQTAM